MMVLLKNMTKAFRILYSLSPWERVGVRERSLGAKSRQPFFCCCREAPASRQQQTSYENILSLAFGPSPYPSPRGRGKNSASAARNTIAPELSSQFHLGGDVAEAGPLD